MKEIFDFWNLYGLQIIESIGIAIGSVIGTIAVIKKKGGKDIDGDGKPDIEKRFNNYFTIINEQRYYLKDLQFYKETKE